MATTKQRQNKTIQKELDGKKNWKTPPVITGDIITLKTINYAEKGDAIAKHKGYVIIVKNADVNKTYNTEITKVFNNFALAKIIK